MTGLPIRGMHLSNGTGPGTEHQHACQVILLLNFIYSHNNINHQYFIIISFYLFQSNYNLKLCNNKITFKVQFGLVFCVLSFSNTSYLAS